MTKKEAMEDISKSLFTASEALREALDTADLGGVDLGNWQGFIDATMKLFEMYAQDMQAIARNK